MSYQNPPPFWPYRDTNVCERSENFLRGRETTPSYFSENGYQQHLASGYLPYPQEFNQIDDGPYPYEDQYYEDYGPYHDTYVPEWGSNSDLGWENQEPYSQLPYSESHSDQPFPYGYSSSPPYQNAQNYESVLDGYSERDVRLEACATISQSIENQLEQIIKLISESPQNTLPSNIENESRETTVFDCEVIESDFENQVEDSYVEDSEVEEQMEKRVEERVEVEEQVEKSFLDITSQEQLEPITLKDQPQALEQEVKNQDEEANRKDDEEKALVEESVEENDEMEEQIEGMILEEDMEEEEECVELSLTMQIMEPIMWYPKEVKKHSLHEKLFKFLKFTKILHCYSPHVYYLLQVPTCDEILQQLSLNRRKMKDLLKKALLGMKLMIFPYDFANKREGPLPRASKLHQMQNRKSRSVPLKSHLIPEGEPNPELLRHVATNSKADERVP